MNLSGIKLRLAQLYCMGSALGHYENFFVLGPLTPLRLMPHIGAVYAFSRHADDLADESNDTLRAAGLLDSWQGELTNAFNDEPGHSITRALNFTASRFNLPHDLFFDLISAFKQDLTKNRYETFDELRDYTRRSADPVGRLVLRLNGYDDPELDALSDNVCTGLQLVNFCQDVREDSRRDRIYVPLAECRQFGVDPLDILSCSPSPNLEKLLHFQHVRAYRFLLNGLQLVERLPGRLRFSVHLFVLSGLQVLDNLRNDPLLALRRRVKNSVGRKYRLLLSAFKRAQHNKMAP